MTERLPVVGSDKGAWGPILTGFLGVAHNDDGTLKTAGLVAEGVTLPDTLSTDTTAEGLLVTKTAGEDLAFGDPVYFKSDGNAWKADANGSATYPCIGLAAEAISSGQSGSILLTGVARNDAWAWTVGGVIYLSTSAGLTQTKPTATDDVVQVLGIAHPNADTIVFRPSLDYLTLA